MDFGLQSTLIRQLFSETLARASGPTQFMAHLDLKSVLVDANSQKPAGPERLLPFKHLIAQVAADGVLTDKEVATLLDHLARHHLMLGTAGAPTRVVDIDGIVLPD